MSETVTDIALLNGLTPPAPPRDNTFRPGKGGQVTAEWADFMLSVWYQAERSGARPPKFSDALKQAMTHFMIDGQP